MPYNTHGDFLNANDKLLAAARANAGQSAVDDLRLQLEKETTDLREAQARRNVHKAAMQKASRDFDRAMDSARKLYSRLRHMVQGLFGISAEKLAEFGLQPFRPVPVSTEKRVQRFLEKEEKERPPVKGQSPTQAANSQTESTS
jgi:hypothetical protein